LTDQINLPSNKEVAGKLVDAKAKERGMLGQIIGTKEHAPTNIAAVALIALISLFSALIFFPVADGVDRGMIMTGLLSTITFVLGLLFGRRMD
jgi:hypothetical protein